MVEPNTRLIEWGHKISFAYVTEGGVDDEALRGLARNICHTNQLLCSSCQGVFLDSEDMTAVYRFCERFLPILDEAAKSIASHETIGIVSQVTLKLYNEELKSHYHGSRIYRGQKSSIIAYCDSDLDISIQFSQLLGQTFAKSQDVTDFTFHIKIIFKRLPCFAPTMNALL